MADGVIPAVVDLVFPRSATPWVFPVVLTDDGNDIDTSASPLKIEVATDATFGTILFNADSLTPSLNGTSITNDGFGGFIVSITAADAALIPTDGQNRVSRPVRFTMPYFGVLAAFMVGNLSVDPY